MALSRTRSLRFSPRPKLSHQITTATTPTSLTFLPTNPTPSLHHPPSKHLPPLLHHRCRRRPFTFFASENGSETPTADSDTAKPRQPQPPSPLPDGARASEVGEEIKRMMKERAEKEGDEGLLSGVAEEVGQIEWPDFKKVVGTTGIVLGVIAGSSVVLLTVNAVLAELSDKVFAGKGVQDFFG